VGVEDWQSAIGVSDLELLCKLGSEFNFDPSFPEEMEVYFVQLLNEARQSGEEIETWLRRRIIEDFKYIDKLPEWIQGEEWQICNGKPMIFIGQIDVPSEAGIFHDESSFYVFLDGAGRETKVVVQVS
jgi:hypothetical protein